VIRTAKVEDIDQVLALLKDFARASLLKYDNWTPADEKVAKQKLLHLILHEYLIVAVKDDKIIGTIGASREQDTWISNKVRMRELFWWVDPAFRRSRLSAELYIRWEQDTNRWLASGKIHQVSLSTQPGSSDLDLGKRGWKCVETHWIRG
jgi:RimJ/RimL family protein N-acetyltransferase